MELFDGLMGMQQKASQDKVMKELEAEFLVRMSR